MPELTRRAVLGGVALSGLLSACGGAPPVSPRTGVDGLRIPTPTPQAEDFVATVDNRWLGITPESRWTYQLTGEISATVAVQVTPGRPVLGVSTTGLESVATDTYGRRAWATTDLLAQDVAGNVWWAAREVDGRAPAPEPFVASDSFGLLMAAEPRLGDGYRVRSAQPGVPEIRATVLLSSPHLTTGAGRFDDVHQISFHTGPRSAAPTDRTLASYAAGVGLVLLRSSTARWELVDHRTR